MNPAAHLNPRIRRHGNGQLTRAQRRIRSKEYRRQVDALARRPRPYDIRPLELEPPRPRLTRAERIMRAAVLLGVPLGSLALILWAVL